jgi:hypothetical protein
MPKLNDWIITKGYERSIQKNLNLPWTGNNHRLLPEDMTGLWINGGFMKNSETAYTNTVLFRQDIGNNASKLTVQADKAC